MSHVHGTAYFPFLHVSRLYPEEPRIGLMQQREGKRPLNSNISQQRLIACLPQARQCVRVLPSQPLADLETPLDEYGK